MARRRWYQFSLRTLLALMVLACLVPGGYVAYEAYLAAKRWAEIEAVFVWFDGLGYPDPSLVPKPLVDPVPSTSESKEELPAEPVDLRERAEKALAAIDQPQDRWSQFGFDLSERAELFVLARDCSRAGHRLHAQKLFEAAERMKGRDDERDGVPLSFVDRLANDFALAEVWRAYVACGEPRLSRPELQRAFQRLAKNYAETRYGEQVRAKAAILQAMVAEDERHARERAAGKPFEELSREEQIAELIFQLRDQNGHQWSQPGSCSVFFTLDGDNSPAHRLAAIGHDAAPQLIDALTDERLTRSVGFHRSFYFSHHVLTVGSAAEQILEHIAGRSFGDAKDVADLQAQMKAWFREWEIKGERQMLIETVEAGDRAAGDLADRLVEKYPEDASLPLLRGIERAKEDWVRTQLVALLGKLTGDEAIPFLIAELQVPDSARRIGAAEALSARGRPEGVDAMLAEWNAAQPNEADGAGVFLLGTGRLDAVAAVTRRFAEQRVYCRMGLVQTAGNMTESESPPPPELRAALVALLLQALDDVEVRSGMSGSYGDKSFSDPRVCDMAGYYLNELDADRFPYDLGAPFNTRETARRKILAVRARSASE